MSVTRYVYSVFRLDVLLILQHAIDCLFADKNDEFAHSFVCAGSCNCKQCDDCIRVATIKTLNYVFKESSLHVK